MNILFLIHKPQARGQELFASLLGNKFLDLGHKVTLLSLYPGEFDLPFQGELLRLNSNSLGIKSLKRLGRWITKIQPDIIQANGGDTLKAMILARLIFPFEGKILFNNGGVLGHYLSSSIHRVFYRFLLSKLDAAVSVSRFSATDLSTWMPKRIAQVTIPIGVNGEKSIDLKPKTPYPVFVSIAGFTPEKNHEFLISAFTKFSQLHSQAQLWLIGDGPLKPIIEKLVKESRPGSIFFLGALTEPWAAVPENAVLLLPSRMEGTPSVLAEASLAKIPSVAFAVGGITQMMEGITSCTLIAPDHEKDFLDAMNFWLNLEEEEKSSRLEISKVMALERFSLDKVTRDFLELYTQVCG